MRLPEPCKTAVQHRCSASSMQTEIKMAHRSQREPACVCRSRSRGAMCTLGLADGPTEMRAFAAAPKPGQPEGTEATGKHVERASRNARSLSGDGTRCGTRKKRAGSGTANAHAYAGYTTGRLGARSFRFSLFLSAPLTSEPSRIRPFPAAQDALHSRKSPAASVEAGPGT